MMITRNFIGVLALCLCALAACTSSKESKKTLTVLSWNVWHGGHSKTYSGKGCEGTIDILKKSEADVVLMIETYGAARYIRPVNPVRLITIHCHFNMALLFSISL